MAIIEALKLHPFPSFEGNFQEHRQFVSVKCIDGPFRQIYFVALIFHTSLDTFASAMNDDGPSKQGNYERKHRKLYKAIYADRTQFVVTNDEGLREKSLIASCGLGVSLSSSLPPTRRINTKREKMTLHFIFGENSMYVFVYK